MPEDLKLSQIGSSQLPPPFRGLHSKHCQIIFACYFRKSSIMGSPFLTPSPHGLCGCKETDTEEPKVFRIENTSSSAWNRWNEHDPQCTCRRPFLHNYASSSSSSSSSLSTSKRYFFKGEGCLRSCVLVAKRQIYSDRTDSVCSSRHFFNFFFITV